MKNSRQREIIRLLEQDKVVNSLKLAAQLQVSLETIRRDLDQLEKRGVLKKVYGGAELLDNYTASRPALAARASNLPLAKAAIAAAAIQHIPDNATIALDSGTTITEFCRHLSAKSGLIVICTDVFSASQLVNPGNNRVYIMGGFLSPDGISSGAFAKEFFSDISGIDIFVCSTDGLSLKDGLTSNGTRINELKRLCIKKANKRILLADHSKFYRKGFYKMCEFADIDTFITDSDTPTDTIEKIRALGTEVVVAKY